MIPKGLHLRNILDTAVEELARFKFAKPEDWAMIEKAAEIRQVTLWNFVRWNLGMRKHEMQHVWRRDGSGPVLRRIWGHLIQAARMIVERADWERSFHAAAVKHLAASKDRKRWAEAEKAASRPMPDESTPLNVLAVMIGELAARPDVDWREIDLAASAKGKSRRAFIGWALIGGLKSIFGYFWKSAVCRARAKNPEAVNSWALCLDAAREVNMACAVKRLPAWLVG